MTFDNEDQKAFVLNFLAQAPLNIPLARLHEAASKYLPILSEIQAGKIADASADSEATV